MRLSDEGIQKQLEKDLAQIIATMVPGSEGERLADAFLTAGAGPPITKQSLSELDIGNIINNIKLRHDVNLDRDLSFRPNLDGAKGQEKLKAAKKYWNALTAELELYRNFFQGSPSVCDLERAPWPMLVAASKKRIPLMFATIQDILKNLVPDRDQARVDEHLDNAMLMQQIEKGVCDLIRLSEWLAHLLKEHCAPMRDEWVDKMVESTRIGVEESSSESIVRGLRELLGILEAMKLDVANHQIRNLRALLIEDTINFEQKYHLSRIARRRINVEIAQRWYSYETHRLRQLSPESFLHKDLGRVQLEVFIHGLIGLLLSNDSRNDFPETFYLDHDRLRTLKSELHDLVYFEICFEIFGLLLKRLGFHGPISHRTRESLRNSLFAIIGEGTGHSSGWWTANREHISVELVRHALHVRGYSHSYDGYLVHEADCLLHQVFYSQCPDAFARHADAVEQTILQEILDCTNRHINSSPMEMFNSLIAPSTPPPPPPPPMSNISAPRPTREQSTSSAPDHLTNIVHRIAHIAMLHWRIWGPIVYVLPEDEDASSNLIAGDSEAEVRRTQTETTSGHRHSNPDEAAINDSNCPPPSEPACNSTPSPTPTPSPELQQQPSSSRPLASQAPEASTLD
ncbi:Tcp11-domain-containing protein [Lepidopterella palustris CBS 459.81]|uniref:Tcp11-domain-containing protein n=1 Tax=Lepidopterella palustris CBS 459.81 TaxID=1314670 RepID=A0A8E2EJV2_9PEZI|nr:Tcp11-domain-containing protein [Lepidopterella palustris CBS 459.81]